MTKKKIAARKSKYGPAGLAGRLAALEASGGELTTERVMQAMHMPKKRAQAAIWSYRVKKKAGKLPTNLAAHGGGPSLYKAGSAVARLLTPDAAPAAEGERLFVAVVQLIGIERAEALIKSERARIVAALRGAA